MAKLSTDGTRAHETSALGVSWGGSLTKGANVFGALGMNMFGRLALEAPYHGGGGMFRVRDDDGITAGFCYAVCVKSLAAHTRV